MRNISRREIKEKKIKEKMKRSRTFYNFSERGTSNRKSLPHPIKFNQRIQTKQSIDLRLPRAMMPGARRYGTKRFRYNVKKAMKQTIL